MTQYAKRRDSASSFESLSSVPEDWSPISSHWSPTKLSPTKASTFERVGENRRGSLAGKMRRPSEPSIPEEESTRSSSISTLTPSPPPTPASVARSNPPLDPEDDTSSPAYIAIQNRLTSFLNHQALLRSMLETKRAQALQLEQDCDSLKHEIDYMMRTWGGRREEREYPLQAVVTVADYLNVRRDIPY